MADRLLRVVPVGGEVERTADLLVEVNAAAGRGWRVVRRFAGGSQSGAWLVVDGTGRSAVLKWSEQRAWSAQVQRAGLAVAAARTRGYPTPAWLAYGVTSAGYGYQVQELVAGRPASRLGLDVARALVVLLERQTGLDPDPGRCWSAYLAPGFADRWTAMSAEVEATGSAGATLVRACRDLVDGRAVPALRSSDLVHGDLRLANVLFDRDAISGVVDIEAVGSGSRVFDYATLLDHEPADDDALRHLVAAGAAVDGPDALAFCFAHVALDLAVFLRGSGPGVPRRMVELATRARFLGQALDA